MNIYRTGTRLANRYEIVQGPAEKASLLGGMGIVYLCYDHEAQRPVALKTFQPQYLADRAARDRFLREGTTWVNLGHHPHIVHCYEVEYLSHGTEVFLVLEQVAAVSDKASASLHDWLQPGHPLPLETALLFALQIVRGLAQAVALVPGFVHRDLKPGNVLVGADTIPGWPVNRVRVTDFGLVAALGEGVVLPQRNGDETALHRTQLTRGWLGTPLYMAPEQWRGEPVTVATDVYALGLILYEMVTGQRAVMARSLAGLEQAHVQGVLNLVPEVFPTQVAQLIHTCLAREPAQRYSTWSALEQDLGWVYQAVTQEKELPAPVAATALGRAERLALGWAHNRLGASYVNIGKLRVAIDYFERAWKLGNAEGETLLVAAGLGNLGIAYSQLGDARRAIGYWEQNLTIIRETSNRVGEDDVLGNLGTAYFQLGDVRRAIGYFEQCLTIAQETGNLNAAGAALGNLGGAYSQLGDAPQAIRYHEQRLTIARLIGDRAGEGQSLGNLGATYLQLGDARRAIGYLEQDLAIAQAMGDHVGEGQTLGNLGVAYRKLGNVQQAIRYYEQRLLIAREVGDIFGLAGGLFNLAILQAQHGELEKALIHATEATDLFVHIGNTDYAQRAQQLVVQLQGGSAAPRGPSPEQILQQFGPVIAAVVSATQGNGTARTQVESLFDTLTQNGWQIAAPIQRIWVGERDEARLAAGLDDADAFIIRAILQQLKGKQS